MTTKLPAFVRKMELGLAQWFNNVLEDIVGESVGIELAEEDETLAEVLSDGVQLCQLLVGCFEDICSHDDYNKFPETEDDFKQNLTFFFEVALELGLIPSSPKITPELMLENKVQTRLLVILRHFISNLFREHDGKTVTNEDLCIQYLPKVSKTDTGILNDLARREEEEYPPFMENEEEEEEEEVLESESVIEEEEEPVHEENYEEEESMEVEEEEESFGEENIDYEMKDNMGVVPPEPLPEPPRAEIEPSEEDSLFKYEGEEGEIEETPKMENEDIPPAVEPVSVGEMPSGGAIVLDDAPDAEFPASIITPHQQTPSHPTIQGQHSFTPASVATPDFHVHSNGTPVTADTPVMEPIPETIQTEEIVEDNEEESEEEEEEETFGSEPVLEEPEMFSEEAVVEEEKPEIEIAKVELSQPEKPEKSSSIPRPVLDNGSIRVARSPFSSTSSSVHRSGAQTTSKEDVRSLARAPASPSSYDVEQMKRRMQALKRKADQATTSAKRTQDELDRAEIRIAEEINRANRATKRADGLREKLQEMRNNPKIGEKPGASGQAQAHSPDLRHLALGIAKMKEEAAREREGVHRMIRAMLNLIPASSGAVAVGVAKLYLENGIYPLEDIDDDDMGAGEAASATKGPFRGDPRIPIVEAENEKLKQEKAKLADRAQALSKELSVQRDRYSKLELSSQSTHSKYLAMKARCADLSKKLDEGKQTLKEVRSTLSSKLEQADAEIKKMRANARNTNKRFVDLRTEHAALTDEFKKLKDSHSEITTQFNVMHETTRSYRDAMKKLGLINSHGDVIESNLEALASQKDKISSKWREHLRKVKDDHALEMKQLEDRLTSRVENLERERAQLEKRLRFSRTDARAARSALSRTRSPGRGRGEATAMTSSGPHKATGTGVTVGSPVSGKSVEAATDELSQAEVSALLNEALEFAGRL